MTSQAPAKPLPTVEAVAAAFSSVIREWLSPAEISAVISTNKAHGYSDSVCATGDYCDSNMAMDAALRELGVESLSEDDDMHMSDEVNVLWNDAWRLAKRNNFKRVLRLNQHGEPAFVFQGREISNFLACPESGEVYSPSKASGFTPETLGFEAWGTGGGHWAWRQDFLFEGKHVYMLLTDGDASLKIEPTEDAMVGVYVDDLQGQDWTGEPFIFKTILAADRSAPDRS